MPATRTTFACWRLKYWGTDGLTIIVKLAVIETTPRTKALLDSVVAMPIKQKIHTTARTPQTEPPLSFRTRPAVLVRRRWWKFGYGWALHTCRSLADFRIFSPLTVADQFQSTGLPSVASKPELNSHVSHRSLGSRALWDREQLDQILKATVKCNSS